MNALQRIFIILLALCSSHSIATTTGVERYYAKFDEKRVFTGVLETFDLIIEPNASSSEYELDLTGVSDFYLDIIIPIEGFSFELYNSEGTLVLDSLSGDITTQLGTTIREDLPGARVALPMLTNSHAGLWKIKYNFPPLIERRLVVMTLRGTSPLGSAIAINGGRFSTESLIPLSVIALENNKPTSKATVQLTISSPDGGTTQLPAFDNGQGADLIANDGIYTTTDYYQPTRPGDYILDSVTKFEVNNQVVTRNNRYEFSADLATIQIDQIEVIDSNPKEQCVDEVIIRLSVTSNKATDYVFLTDVQDVNANSYPEPPSNTVAKTRINLPAGQHTVDLAFDNKTLIERYGHGAELNLRPISVTEPGTINDNRGVVLSSPLVPIAQTFLVDETTRCRDMVEIPSSMTVTENRSADGFYIESLTFNVPAYVQLEGQYTANVTVYPEGSNQALAFLPTKQNLVVGDNTLRFNVQGADLSVIDGPYSLRGLLFYGQGLNSRVNNLGSTKAYQKEVFIPKRAQLVPASLFGLKRENWQGHENQPMPVRVGGYHRFNPAVGWDYEALAKFDLAGINPESILDAYIEVKTANNTIPNHLNKMHIHEVTSAWQPENVNYEHFCENLGTCQTWPDQLATLHMTKNDDKHVIRDPAILNLVKKWTTDSTNNLGIAITSAPHERSQYVEVTAMELVLVLR